MQEFTQRILRSREREREKKRQQSKSGFFRHFISRLMKMNEKSVCVVSRKSRFSLEVYQRILECREREKKEIKQREREREEFDEPERMN